MTAYRSRYRRRASEHPTAASESSLSGGFPTPLARDAIQGACEGRNSPSMLEVAALFPTPKAQDAKGTSPGDMKRNDPSLPEVAALFPTPTAARYGSSNNGQPHDGRREEYATKGKPSLDALAGKWPTAVVTDAESAGRHTTATGVMHPGTSLTDALRQWSTRLDRETWQGGGATLPAAARRPVLNPRFVEALMGFPRGWLDLTPKLASAKPRKSAAPGKRSAASTSKRSRRSGTPSSPSAPKSPAGSSECLKEET